MLKIAVTSIKIHFTPKSNLRSLIESQRKHFLMTQESLGLIFQTFKKRKITISKMINLNSIKLEMSKMLINQLVKLWILKEKYIRSTKIICLMVIQIKLININSQINFKWTIKDQSFLTANYKADSLCNRNLLFQMFRNRQYKKSLQK
jgi:hypothetical protein